MATPETESEEELLRKYATTETYLDPFILDQHDFSSPKLQRYQLQDEESSSTKRKQNIKPQWSVGLIDRLPFELLTEILLGLDILSLTTFRRVNARAQSLVDGLHQYRSISENCPNILKALISLEAAQFFGVKTVYDTLKTGKCSSCDRFGNYLYLITCQRVCYPCSLHLRSYWPFISREAAGLTHMSERALNRLPHVHSLPGSYEPCGGSWGVREYLFDRQAILDIAVTAREPSLRSNHYDRITAIPTHCGSMLRRIHMVIMSAPRLGSATSADWGYWCKECLEDQSLVVSMEKYLRTDFFAHIRQHQDRKSTMRKMSPTAGNLPPSVLDSRTDS